MEMKLYARKELQVNGKIFKAGELVYTFNMQNVRRMWFGQNKMFIYFFDKKEPNFEKYYFRVLTRSAYTVVFDGEGTGTYNSMIYEKEMGWRR